MNEEWQVAAANVSTKMTSLHMTQTFCLHYCAGLRYEYGILRGDDCLCVEQPFRSDMQGGLVVVTLSCLNASKHAYGDQVHNHLVEKPTQFSYQCHIMFTSLNYCPCC